MDGDWPVEDVLDLVRVLGVKLGDVGLHESGYDGVESEPGVICGEDKVRFLGVKCGGEKFPLDRRELRSLELGDDASRIAYISNIARN